MNFSTLILNWLITEFPILDFEEKEATLGRKYYPHKDRIVEPLLKLHSEHSDELPIEIKREDININLISNYLVNYQDQYGTSIFIR